MYSFVKTHKDTLLVFFAFVLVRLPHLGRDIINTDAYWWKTRTYNFGNALTNLNLEETAQTYHPGVTLLWINNVSVKIFSLLDRIVWQGSLERWDLFFANHVIQKTILVVVLGVLFTLMYINIKRMYGFKIALFFALLLGGTPFYLGLSRVLHTDALLMSFMFLSFLYVKRYFLDLKNITLILAGIFTGLALLTKSNSLLILPLAFFVMAVETFYQKDQGFDITSHNASLFFTVLAKYLAIAAITFMAVWPAMWVRPVDTLSSYFFGIVSVGIEGGHKHIYMGQNTSDPGAIYYIYTFFGRVDEITIFLFFFGLSIYLFSKDKFDKRFVIYALGFTLFYVAVLMFPSKKLDRYVLPVFPFIILVSAYALSVVVNRFRVKLGLVGTVLFLYLLFVGIKLHPNYLAYYSSLIGGYDKGRYYVGMTWPVGYDNLAEYFNALPNAHELAVVIENDHNFRPFFKGATVDMDYLDVPRKDYVVLYSFHPKPFDLGRYEKVKTLQIAGVDYYDIYKRVR